MSKNKVTMNNVYVEGSNVGIAIKNHDEVEMNRVAAVNCRERGIDISLQDQPPAEVAETRDLRKVVKKVLVSLAVAAGAIVAFASDLKSLLG